MLLSMTGFGEARRQTDELSVGVEVRTINSKYFKLSVRSPDGYAALEPQIEAVVREQIRRGAIQVSLRVDRALSPQDFEINGDILRGYQQQIELLTQEMHLQETVSIDALLTLPGVVNEDNVRSASQTDLSNDWPVIKSALVDAMNNLSAMRAQEGKAMAADLKSNCQTIASELDLIEARAPQVVESYRSRLTERINRLLEEYDVRVEPVDIVREIGIFTERSDISEECVRLRSHLAQFEVIMNQTESAGRKLEFVTQEMIREVNTIGSKANDTEIPSQVIEIKASIERIREMIQNVE